MVIIQPSTEKVVVVDEMITIDAEVEDDASARAKGKWNANVGTKKRETQPKTVSVACFLPRGRKDRGESVQQAAFREAFEESGYEVSPLPLYVYNRQTLSPHQREADTGLSEEAIYLTTQRWDPRYRDGKCIDKGGQYFVSWFVGQIPENPIHHTGVGMPDEQNYVSRLLPFEEALNALSDPLQRCVLDYAWQAYRNHLHYDRELKKLEAELAQPEAEVGAEAGTRVDIRHEGNTSGEQ
ncbi:hypothetical protein D9758_006561 [Tetrapyrgos nigripes]|uniref:Nudix hydrolase domain-containing protein n=1 Tax=Tetrapyrgos nigripes TaxID=182062 RepID=A0A8H5GKI0_9AGAR|nr:hypothetical protein D9758_006561 [Tetrapyrgos nigripes]